MTAVRLLPLFLLTSAPLLAQTAPAPAPLALPDNEIFAVPLSRDTDGWHLGPAENLTLRPGYDNQPAFLPDGSAFLYTADLEPGQTDVQRMSWPGRTSTRVIATPVSEYSPTPRADGKGYTSVVVEADGTQRLWQYAPDGSGAFVLLPDIRGVGYHTWLAPDRVALFILGDEKAGKPNTLHVVDVATAKGFEVAANVGRSLHRVPGTERVSWVDKTDPKAWRIVASDGRGGPVEALVDTLPEAEDFTWLPDGSILMASGAEIFRWSGERGTGFRSLGVVADIPGTINRMTVNPAADTLVFVVTVKLPRTRGIRG